MEERDNVLLLMAINGLFHPYLAAIFGFLWVTARIIYGIGYATKGPSGRTLGFALSQLLGTLPLVVLTAWNGFSLA